MALEKNTISPQPSCEVKVSGSQDMSVQNVLTILSLFVEMFHSGPK